MFRTLYTLIVTLFIAVAYAQGAEVDGATGGQAGSALSLAYEVPVDCPAEDSCTLHYRSDGRWLVERDSVAWVAPTVCPTEDSCYMDFAPEIDRWIVTPV